MEKEGWSPKLRRASVKEGKKKSSNLSEALLSPEDQNASRSRSRSPEHHTLILSLSPSLSPKRISLSDQRRNAFPRPLVHDNTNKDDDAFQFQITPPPLPQSSFSSFEVTRESQKMKSPCEKMSEAFLFLESGKFPEALDSIGRAILLFGEMLRKLHEEEKKEREERGEGERENDNNTSGNSNSNISSISISISSSNNNNNNTRRNNNNDNNNTNNILSDMVTKEGRTSEIEGVIILRMCAVYKLAITILIQIKLFESAINHKHRGAFLLSVLALLPLLPLHRNICLRMAIRENITFRNYGIASLFASLLWPTCAQGECNNVMEVLSLCEKQEKRNYGIPSRSNPFVGPLLSPSLSSLSSMLTKEGSCYVGRPLISFSSLKLIEGEYVCCEWCCAAFLNSERSVGDVCVVCHFGEMKSSSPPD